VPSNPENIVAKCSYGNIFINSIIQKDNIIGCQFHPEKSGESGLKLINNFCKF
jgi:glutamine amidotransferase